MLQWYIKFLDKTLPSLRIIPFLYAVVLEFKLELESKISNRGDQS